LLSKVVRAGWLLWALAAWAQEPLRVWQEGETVVVSLAGGAIPLEPLGAEWAGVVLVQFRFFSAEGGTAETAADRIDLRINEKRRRALLEERVKVSRQIPAGAGAVRATVVALPSQKELGELEMALTPPAAFRVETGVALVPFQFERAAKGLVAELTAEDIVLTEDGRPRAAKLAAVRRESRETVPVEITLLFDCSYSVAAMGAIDPEVFRRGLLEEFPNVRIAVFGFSDDLMEFTPHTRDERALEAATKAVALVSPRSTPLFGSIERTVRRFDLSRPALRMLVVFSDGESSSLGDRGASNGAVDTARKAGVAIYPVELAALAGRMSASRMSGEGSLGRTPVRAPRGEFTRMDSTREYQSMAERTGGVGFSRVANATAVETVLRSVAARLRGVYVASYQPELEERPRERRVRVELRDKSLGRVTGAVRSVIR
jgi:VWFA-related protein